MIWPLLLAAGVLVLIFSPKLIALSKGNRNAQWAPSSAHTVGVIGIGAMLILMAVVMALSA